MRLVELLLSIVGLAVAWLETRLFASAARRVASSSPDLATRLAWALAALLPFLLVAWALADQGEHERRALSPCAQIERRASGLDAPDGSAGRSRDLRWRRCPHQRSHQWGLGSPTAPCWR